MASFQVSVNRFRLLQICTTLALLADCIEGRCSYTPVVFGYLLVFYFPFSQVLTKYNFPFLFLEIGVKYSCIFDIATQRCKEHLPSTHLSNFMEPFHASISHS